MSWIIRRKTWKGQITLVRIKTTMKMHIWLQNTSDKGTDAWIKPININLSAKYSLLLPQNDGFPQTIEVPLLYVSLCPPPNVMLNKNVTKLSRKAMRLERGLLRSCDSCVYGYFHRVFNYCSLTCEPALFTLFVIIISFFFLFFF